MSSSINKYLKYSIFQYAELNVEAKKPRIYFHFE